MSSYSFHRRNFSPSFEGIVTKRRNLLNGTQTIGGRSVQDRNPCYIAVTGHNKSCGGSGSLSLPDFHGRWSNTYNTFKPTPILESVTIEYAGENNMARRISGTIKCFDVYDFENIQKYFLLPGNEIDARFGYHKSWAGETATTELKGFTVAVFAFNTTAEGFWICTFTAVSAATAIQNLEMQLVICNGCNAIGGSGQSGDTGPLKYLTGENAEKHAVKGVAQLIASDAQKNGSKSIDELEDGEVVTDLLDYNPGSYDNSAAMVIYTGDHTRSKTGRAMLWIGGIVKNLSGTNNEVESSNNQVYVTLGYIVNRIINCQLLRSFTCHIAHERDKFNKLKVDFHPNYSKCKIADGIVSGNPLHILMLGQANYMNVKNMGKDFDKDCKNLTAVKSNMGGGNIHLQNILIHRDVVASCYAEATKPKPAESDSTDPINETKDQVVNIIDFFAKISAEISACTGNAIALKLVENPDNLNTLIVVDQNYGVSEELRCIVFDPIDGDGNTRTCEVQSNVGSQEYRVTMFVGSSTKGDPVTTLRNCNTEQTNQREIEQDKAKTDRFSIIKNPGNLGENYFNDTEIDALKAVMGRLNRNNVHAVEMQSLHYPGLSMSITINGVFGIEPGNAISTTQVPATWRNAYNSYFMVTSVKHQFVGSDWSTTIEGILAYYNNIKYINL